MKPPPCFGLLVRGSWRSRWMSVPGDFDRIGAQQPLADIRDAG
jgi:hypothetical protein